MDTIAQEAELELVDYGDATVVTKQGTPLQLYPDNVFQRGSWVNGALR